MNPKRRATWVGWLIVLVLFAGAGLLLRRDVGMFQHTPGQDRIGRQAPDATVVALDGRSQRLGALRGRPIWLNFFATWCGPCKLEMPDIEIEYRRFHRDGLEVLGLDQQESARLVAAFVRPFGLSFPLVLDNGGAAAAYGVFAIPTSVFVDRRGVIQAVHIGAMTPAQMEADLRKIM